MRVFICYAREDREVAHWLYAALKGVEELDPWLDYESLKPGEEWESRVLETITGSDLFIVLLSRLSVRKQGFIRKEIETAVSHSAGLGTTDPFVVPIRIEDCESPDALTHLHGIDLFPDRDSGVRKLRAVFVGKLTRGLADVFRSVNRHMTGAQRRQWLADYADHVRRYSATTVLRHLDAAYSSLADELTAVSLMIELSRRERWDGLVPYVFRAHQITRLAYDYPNDLARACGLFLEKAKHVPDTMRTVLLRDAFTGWVELAHSLGNTFPCCLVVTEVGKHYVAQRAGRYHSDWQVVSAALDVLSRYDLLFLEMVVFYARRSGKYRVLCEVAPVLDRQFPGHGFGRSAPKFPTSDYYLLDKWDQGKMEQVLSFDNIGFGRKLGLLFRVAQHARRDDDPEVRAYGNRVRDVALAILQTPNRPVPHDAAAACRADNSEMFDALERYDTPAVGRVLGVDEGVAHGIVEFLMSPLCAFRDHDVGVTDRFVAIQDQVFHETCEGDIRILR